MQNDTETHRYCRSRSSRGALRHLSIKVTPAEFDHIDLGTIDGVLGPVSGR